MIQPGRRPLLPRIIKWLRVEKDEPADSTAQFSTQPYVHEPYQPTEPCQPIEPYDSTDDDSESLDEYEDEDEDEDDSYNDDPDDSYDEVPDDYEDADPGEADDDYETDEFSDDADPDEAYEDLQDVAKRDRNASKGVRITPAIVSLAMVTGYLGELSTPFPLNTAAIVIAVALAVVSMVLGLSARRYAVTFGVSSLILAIAVSIGAFLSNAPNVQ